MVTASCAARSWTAWRSGTIATATASATPVRCGPWRNGASLPCPAAARRRQTIPTISRFRPRGSGSRMARTAQRMISSCGGIRMTSSSDGRALMSRILLVTIVSVALLCQPVVTSRRALGDDPLRVVDPTKVPDIPGGLGSRVAAGRARLVKERGGNAVSEAAVAKGLRWLALHQAPDGGWSLSKFNQHVRTDLKSDKYVTDPGLTGRGLSGATGDISGTAFGLLPFLGAGITHKTAEKQPGGEYAPTVQRAL